MARWKRLVMLHVLVELVAVEFAAARSAVLLRAAHLQHVEKGHEKHLVLDGVAKEVDAASTKRRRYGQRSSLVEVDDAVDHVEHHCQTIA